MGTICIRFAGIAPALIRHWGVENSSNYTLSRTHGDQQPALTAMGQYVHCKLLKLISAVLSGVMDASGKPPVVLCVDDNPSVLTLIKIALEDSGYSVLTANGGQEALELFRSQTVDAVVLDYEMPGMNGVQAAMAMKLINRNVPKVLFTANPIVPAEACECVEAFCTKSGIRSLVSQLQRLVSAQPPAEPTQPAAKRMMSLHTHLAIARLGLE